MDSCPLALCQSPDPLAYKSASTKDLRFICTAAQSKWIWQSVPEYRDGITHGLTLPLTDIPEQDQPMFEATHSFWGDSRHVRDAGPVASVEPDESNDDSEDEDEWDDDDDDWGGLDDDDDDWDDSDLEDDEDDDSDVELDEDTDAT